MVFRRGSRGGYRRSYSSKRKSAFRKRSYGRRTGSRRSYVGRANTGSGGLTSRRANFGRGLESNTIHVPMLGPEEFTGAVSTTTNRQFHGRVFTLDSSSYAYASYVGMFELCRLNMVIVRFVPVSTSYVGQDIDPSLGASVASPDRGRLYVVVDYNDANSPPNLNKLLNDPTVRTVAAGQPLTLKFRPRVSSLIYNAGTAPLPSYTTPGGKNPWVRTVDSGTPYYGIKWATVNDETGAASIAQHPRWQMLVSSHWSFTRLIPGGTGMLTREYEEKVTVEAKANAEAIRAADTERAAVVDAKRAKLFRDMVKCRADSLTSEEKKYDDDADAAEDALLMDYPESVPPTPKEQEVASTLNALSKVRVNEPSPMRFQQTQGQPPLSRTYSSFIAPSVIQKK